MRSKRQRRRKPKRAPLVHILRRLLPPSLPQTRSDRASGILSKIFLWKGNTRCYCRRLNNIRFMYLENNWIILILRLTDSNLKVPEEKAAKVATKIEKELFSFFRDTDAKYKNKYRSLMFNLKDPKNNVSMFCSCLDLYASNFPNT